MFPHSLLRFWFLFFFFFPLVVSSQKVLATLRNSYLQFSLMSLFWGWFYLHNLLWRVKNLLLDFSLFKWQHFYLSGQKSTVSHWSHTYPPSFFHNMKLSISHSVCSTYSFGSQIIILFFSHISSYSSLVFLPHSESLSFLSAILSYFFSKLQSVTHFNSPISLIRVHYYLY